jgi:hypothetical protein
METIRLVTLAILLVLNVFFAVINFHVENYKLSTFNSFAGGVCFLALINQIIEMIN